MTQRTQEFFLAFLTAILLLSVPQFAAAQTAAPVCINLTADVGSGMSDTISNGPISELQNFLVAQGYLTATPNGHFGPATLAAVESFQRENGIFVTGYVGPLTRAFIENKTCFATNTTASTSSSGTSTNIPVQTISTPQTLAITSPATNETLTLGSNYTIQWAGNPGYNYNIVLENQNGVGEGIIGSNLSTGNQYVWQVGKIISSDGTGYLTIAPGVYQIHIEVNSGTDLYSGLFTVGAPEISINSVVPSSAPADGNTSVVLLGSGFISPATIYINGYSRTNALFVSPDGRVIVFSVPLGIPAGVQSIYASNQYGTYSNSATLTVTSPPIQ